MPISTPAPITKDEAREIARTIAPSVNLTTDRGLVDELFGPDHIPGTFAVAERKNNPVFIDDDCAGGYGSWVRSMTQSHLQALARAGLAPTSLDDEYIRTLGDAVLVVLDSPLKSGAPLCEHLTNQQATDMVWRILKALLYRDPFHPLHVFREFNEIGRELALALLAKKHVDRPDLALRRSVIAGALGVDVKSQYTAAGPSPVVRSGIIRMITTDGTLRDLEQLENEIDARTIEGLAIDFLPEFRQEVIDRSGPGVCKRSGEVTKHRE